MKLLFIAKQKKNVDTFEGVVAALLKAGHAVTLAIQQRDPDRDRRLSEQFADRGFELTTCPEGRGDAWRASAPLVRSVRDWAQYFRPPYRQAAKLRQRATDRLLKELGATGGLDGESLVLNAGSGTRLRDVLERLERTIPSDPLHEEFLDRHAPDALIVTPGLHFGSGQTDFIKSARAKGIPVWMLLFSWDNLSTKGALHAPPDLMFVWNERQVQEAVELHDFPAERVVVVGAPRFDEFFSLRSVVSREDFVAPLRLDSSRPTVLYMCSSRFIAENELTFIREWLVSVRRAAGPLQRCNVIVRPHPDVVLVNDSVEPQTVMWSAMPQVTGWIQRPFDDPAAIVLRTTYRTQQAFYECLVHSEAVVALNTSAELEAGIAGRPVFTVLSSDASADGQSNTLHFNYLLRDHGGFVSYAPDLTTHVAQLATALTAPPNEAEIRAFIMRFLRPSGDQPVSELLASSLVQHDRRRPSSIIRAGKRPEEDEAQQPGIVDLPAKPEKVLRLGDKESSIKVYATPETRRLRRQGVLSLDPAVVKWLNEQVRPGDVVYDIGAGVGAYSIIAAVQRGGLAVAFEPGFAAFKALCDNLLLNSCYRSVMPLPVALGDRTGLLELEYLHDAGDDVHALHAREWRTRRDSVEAHYTQPVCAEQLDDVFLRHRLPAPNVVRVAVRRGAEAVLQGAVRLLRSPQLRSLLVLVKDDAQVDSVAAAVRGGGFTIVQKADNGDHGLTLSLERTSAPRGMDSPMETFRRAGRHLRRLW